MNIYDFLLNNTIYYVVFMPIIILIGIVFSIFFAIKLYKTKNKFYILSLFISIIIVYQIIPYYFEIKAYYSKDYVKYYEYAIKSSIFPMQKGIMCSDLASYYGSRDLSLAIEYHEKAYKYLKNYDGGFLIWAPAVLAYYMYGDFDKTIEIGTAIKSYALAANAYVMKNDFENALVSINKELEKRPTVPLIIASKANILRNLGREKEALENYKKAISLCSDDKKIEMVNIRYNNKNFVKDDWNRMRNHAKSKGVVL